MRAVGEDEIARFLAHRALLDDDLRTGRAEGAREQSAMAAAARRVSATVTPLPAERPSALTTMGTGWVFR